MRTSEVTDLAVSPSVALETWVALGAAAVPISVGNRDGHFRVLDVDLDDACISFDVVCRQVGGPGRVSGVITACLTPQGLGSRMTAEASLRRFSAGRETPTDSAVLDAVVARMVRNLPARPAERPAPPPTSRAPVTLRSSTDGRRAVAVALTVLAAAAAATAATLARRRSSSMSMVGGKR